MQHLLIKNISELKKYKEQKRIIKKNKLNIINKIKNKKNKQQTILGEILLIEGLKKFYNIDYQNIDITYNKNGKPYILNSNIYYNISHSNDYVVCIFSNKEIGIDIEKIIKPNDNIIKNILTEEEQNYSKTNLNFFEIFTLKEAYIKCLGNKIFDFKNIELVFNNKPICKDTSVKSKQLIIDNYIISIVEKR